MDGGAGNYWMRRERWKGSISSQATLFVCFEKLYGCSSTFFLGEFSGEVGLLGCLVTDDG